MNAFEKFLSDENVTQMITEKPRECYITNHKEKALFHCWGIKIGWGIGPNEEPFEHPITVGIIEFEDGQVREIEPDLIKFLVDAEYEKYLGSDADNS